MIAITVDCEQWNSLSIRGKEDPNDNNTNYSLKGNEKLLEIFDKYKVKATFFTTGFFAEREKKQVKKISKKHEIASHSYCHFYRGNPKLDLEKDISKSKKILENITGKNISGFRAPQAQFSLELIKILEKLKFTYDSSLHSAWLPGFYNHRGEPLKPFKPIKGKNIVEIPASASYNLRLPFSWFFMRNLPLRYTIKIVGGLLKRGVIPVIYVHSWEFINLKKIKGLPLGYVRNTGEKFCEKLERFLEHFKSEKFVVMGEICKKFKGNLI